VPQHQWVSKLFGFDFDVEYRPGRLNTVADALSRKDAEAAPAAPCAAVAAALSGPSFVLMRFAGEGPLLPTPSSKNASVRGSYRHHGTRIRAFCSTVPASLCPTSVTSVTRPSSWRMALAMRAPRRLCIGSGQNSTSQVTEP
jgi:hypothetical protein